MRGRARACSGLALAMVLLACEGRATPTPVPTATAAPTAAPATRPASSPTHAPSSTTRPDGDPITCPDASTSRTLVAFRRAGDLWLTDLAALKPSQLTHDGDARIEREPAFVGGTCLVFATTNPSAIALLSLRDGRTTEIATDAGVIAGFAVTPDRTAVVYLHIDFDVDSTYRLKRLALAGGVPEVLHTFNPNIGRGGSSEDEVSLAWSPDGSELVVVNTHAYSDAEPRGGMDLFQVADWTIRAHWAGTHPRWSPDGRTIFYRTHADGGDQRWHAFDTATLQTTTVGFRAGTNNLVVSPDGRRVAYDTSWFGDTPMGMKAFDSPPNVYLYDLESGQESLLRRASLAPRWTAVDTLVVTDAGMPAEESWNSWSEPGTTHEITVGGNASSVDQLTTTEDIAILLGG